MAWSSLSSLEIPTKADVQEALNSVSGIKYVWNGNTTVNNSGSNTNISFMSISYNRAIIFGFLSEWGNRHLSVLLHANYAITYENYVTSGSHEYICNVFCSNNYVRFQRVGANGLDNLNIRTMIFV